MNCEFHNSIVLIHEVLSSLVLNRAFVSYELVSSEVLCSELCGVFAIFDHYFKIFGN